MLTWLQTGIVRLKALILLKLLIQLLRTLLFVLFSHSSCDLQLDLTSVRCKEFFFFTINYKKNYMSQLVGLVNKAYPTHVCLLHKSVNGIKQAPRA